MNFPVFCIYRKWRRISLILMLTMAIGVSGVEALAPLGDVSPETSPVLIGSTPDVPDALTAMEPVPSEATSSTPQRENILIIHKKQEPLPLPKGTFPKE